MAERKGITRYWTEAQEKQFEGYLNTCDTPALRHLVMTIRDVLKYDHRTREAKRAIAQARLRIAIASDAELWELARVRALLVGRNDSQYLSESFKSLKELRQQLQEKGIRKEELTAKDED